MAWKETLNGALTRATGYQLQRAGAPRRAAKRRAWRRAGDRLVEAPVFVICTLRSGSTLLRVLLDSHSQIRSPHELHLRYVSVHFDQKWSERSMKELGLDDQRRRVPAVGPAAAPRARRQRQARSSSTRRPTTSSSSTACASAGRTRASSSCSATRRAIARSRQAVRGAQDDAEQNAELILRYCEALEAARQTYDGHTVRYEDLTADPRARDARDLRVPRRRRGSRAMLEYGKFDHGRFKAGLGDWSDKIKTGQIQPPEPPPPPEEIPPALREMSEKWGYLDAEVPLDRSA